MQSSKQVSPLRAYRVAAKPHTHTHIHTHTCTIVVSDFEITGKLRKKMSSFEHATADFQAVSQWVAFAVAVGEAHAATGSQACD